LYPMTRTTKGNKQPTRISEAMRNRMSEKLIPSLNFKRYLVRLAMGHVEFVSTYSVNGTDYSLVLHSLVIFLSSPRSCSSFGGCWHDNLTKVSPARAEIPCRLGSTKFTSASFCLDG
jgi:hypothetical protein